MGGAMFRQVLPNGGLLDAVESLLEVAKGLVASSARSDAEEIYESSLKRPYWREVSRKFPKYNSDMKQEADATDWILRRISHDFKRYYQDGWSRIEYELMDMIQAGLT